MKIKASLIIILGLVLLFAAFKSMPDELFQIPKNWPKPNYDFSKNSLNQNKIIIGRALFYDPILSRNNTISCASCHSQYTAFTHVDHDLSHGIDDRIGSRNSPTLMNLAWHTSFMWDGAIHHLDVQALAPISHPDEMDESIENVIKKLQRSSIYPKLFYKAFNDSIITGERTLKSLAQFLLTLVSSNSKYDSVMRSQTQFTQQEKKGYSIFQKHCASCHSEPLFTNMQFENNGLSLDKSLNDYGRMKHTQKNTDSLKFKVPTLRNIEFSYSYMHDGRFKSLNAVLSHYSSGIQQSHTLAKQLQNPIALNSNEKVDLISFLLTLTDKKFLFDPDYAYPKFILFPKRRMK